MSDVNGTNGTPGAIPPQFPVRDYRVGPERGAITRRARRSVVFVALCLLVLSLLPWVFFQPGPGVRPSLGYAALVLTVLALLLLLRIFFITRKADRFLAPDGAMLRLDPAGITISGDTFIPWQAVSGAWTYDTGDQLRARAKHPLFGVPGGAMLKAGVNTANITFGITDVALVSDPSLRVKRFKTLPSGATPGRIEFPFGSQFTSDELRDAFAVLRWALPAEVPARFATGVLDYAAAWAGTGDDVAAIRKRDAESQ